MTAPIRPDVTQVARPRPRSWLDRLREGIPQESAGIPAVAPDVTSAPDRYAPPPQPTIGPGRSGLERAASTVEAGMDDAGFGVPGYLVDALAAAADPRRTFGELRDQRAERREKVDPRLLLAMGTASAPQALVGKSRSLLDLVKKHEGFTLGTRSGKPLVQGYSVGAGAMRNAALPEAERLALSSQGVPMSQLRPDDIEEVIARIQKDKDNAFGGWWNKKDDMVFMEPATQSLHLPPTFARGMERGEQGIGDLRKYAAREDGFIPIPKKLDDGTFGDYDLGVDLAGLRPYFRGDPTKTASWLARTGWRGASGREADIALAEAINQLMRQRK